MTRKDFIIIAKILNNSIKYSNDKIECMNYIINELTSYLYTKNNKFDKQRFINAVLN